MLCIFVFFMLLVFMLFCRVFVLLCVVRFRLFLFVRILRFCVVEMLCLRSCSFSLRCFSSYVLLHNVVVFVGFRCVFVL